ncbi:hypothetical protein [Pseudomonas sp. B10(2017)]|uniref:hypothetical protein n=1 Tax=Pseudomonas sp. B10(2017) TaxID=1981749 RepID=UPI001302E65D|nr:hypothetical protein [Pseudomonas sp. B10(2017)]
MPLKREVDLVGSQDSLQLAISDSEYCGSSATGHTLIAQGNDPICQLSVSSLLSGGILHWLDLAWRLAEFESFASGYAPKRSLGLAKEFRYLATGHSLGKLGDLRGASSSAALLRVFRLMRSRLGPLWLGLRVLALGQRPVGEALQHDQLATRCEEGRFGGLQVD